MILKIENLTKSYSNHEVLKGLTFSIEEGKIFGFLGKNGAGKSTTMNILTGLIHFNEGEIFYEFQKDKPLSLKANKREILKQIGYLPQSQSFYGYMTNVEYLSMMATILGMNKKAAEARIDEVLSRVGLSECKKQKISGYSGGMLSRLGVAVALFNKPKIIFLDEPTAALDPAGRLDILSLIKELKEEGITVFLSTHILNDIERICDEVCIINEGKILLQDSLVNLKNQHFTHLFDIDVTGEVSELRNFLLSLDYIKQVEISGQVLTIEFVVGSEDTNLLLTEIMEKGYTINSFNGRTKSLEEIFMGLVSTHE